MEKTDSKKDFIGIGTARIVPVSFTGQKRRDSRVIRDQTEDNFRGVSKSLLFGRYFGIYHIRRCFSKSDIYRHGQKTQ